AAPACSAEERFARSRLIAITFAPQAASASTIASPSPWLPPVMTTRFPFRFCMFILLLGLPLACPVLPLYCVKPAYCLKLIGARQIVSTAHTNFDPRWLCRPP